MKIQVFFFLLVAVVNGLVFAAPDSVATAKLPVPIAAAKDTVAKDSASKPTPVKPAPALQNATTKKAAFEEEDLLIEEADVKKNAVRDAAIKDSLAKIQAAHPVVADSTKSIVGKATAPDSAHGTATTLGVDSAIAKKDSVSIAAPIVVEKPKEIVPAKVETIHSINFAKNLKDYRSPKVAMFLSLLVPGLGQAYTKHYVKAGVFVALEGAAIGLSVYYNNKGKKQYNDGKAFADQNYDFKTFNTYYDNLQILIGQDKINGIYFDSLNSMKAANNDRSPEFYRNLEGKSNVYIQGWNDCEPSLDQMQVGKGSIIKGKYFNYSPRFDADSSYYLVDLFDTSANGKLRDSLQFGYSENQVAYSNMMSKSNEYYKLASTILTVMILNHLVSAIDALIGANAYNNELLGKETLWQHIKIDQQWVDNGAIPSPGLAIRVNF